MKHNFISITGHLPVALLACVLLALCSACGDNSPKPRTDPVDNLVGEYVGTLAVDDGNETTGVKLLVEKVDGKTVAVRPQSTDATAFQAQTTSSGAQFVTTIPTMSETPGRTVTGLGGANFEPGPQALEYVVQITINGQARWEHFKGNRP